MLTKEERAAIAERANECVEVCGSLYEVLLGHRSAGNTTYEEDMNKLLARIIDLCDTSNMIELPVDKDGEVIRIGDTVFDDDGAKVTVCSIRFNKGGDFVCTYSADSLTRKNPISVQSISKRMQGVLEDYLFSVDSNLHTELVSIADQLKELAGKDEE